MKYTVIAIQTGIKYYVAFDRQHGGCLVDTPKLFDTREEAEIEVYRLHDKDTKNIRKLYYKVWKNTVSWKVFRKGYFKDTRYLVEEIDDNFFNRKILIQTMNLDTIHSEIDKLCENVDKIYNQDRNIIITISSLGKHFEKIKITVKYDEEYNGYDVVLSVLGKEKFRSDLDKYPKITLLALCSQIVNEYLGKEKWGYIERIKEDRR